jgi:hypothetical protein
VDKTTITALSELVASSAASTSAVVQLPNKLLLKTTEFGSNVLSTVSSCRSFGLELRKHCHQCVSLAWR